MLSIQAGFRLASADAALPHLEADSRRHDGPAAAGREVQLRLLRGRRMSGFAFEFFNLPRIIFGAGSAARLPELSAGLGKNPLVIHSGPTPSFVPGIYLHQRGEPTVGSVDAALEMAQQHGCDVLLAVGGGSAI